MQSFIVVKKARGKHSCPKEGKELEQLFSTKECV
jgi:hypothetical protein